MTAISENEVSIFSGHDNGEVFKHLKYDKSDLYVKLSRPKYKIKVSEYPYHVAIFGEFYG